MQIVLADQLSLDQFFQLPTLKYGTQLGWVIDPEERVVLIYRRDQVPEELIGEAQLPCLEGFSLSVTVDQRFGWLKGINVSRI